jgi:hypothetical protein
MSIDRQSKARWKAGFLRTGLVSAVMLALATTAGASVPLIDGPFEIAVGAFDHINPAIAYNQHQEQFLVAYEFGTGGFSHVLLTKHGTVAWDPPIVTFNLGEHPALAYNSAANQYLLVWQQFDAVSSLYELWGLRLASDGLTAIGNGFIIASSVFELKHPEIAFNTHPHYEDFLVVWQQVQVGLPFGWNEIWAQRVAGLSGGAPGGGDLIGGNFQVAGGNHLQTDSEPDVAYNLNMNEYLVVYTREPSAGGQSDVYSRRITRDGVLLSEQHVDKSANDQRNPSVAAFHLNHDTPYLVAYTDFWNDPAGDVRGYRLSKQAQPQALVNIATVPGRQEQMPDLATSEPLEGYTVVWEQTDNDWDIMGRRVHSDGAMEEVFNISLYGLAAVPCHEQSSVVAGGSPVAMVVWQDNCQGSAGSWNIFGRLLGYRVYLPLVVR